MFEKVLETFKVEMGNCEFGLDWIDMRVKYPGFLNTMSIVLDERNIWTLRVSSCDLALASYGQSKFIYGKSYVKYRPKSELKVTRVKSVADVLMRRLRYQFDTIL